MKSEFWIAQKPKIEISKKFEVFQKSIWLMTRTTEISEKNVDEFSRICQ